MLEYTVAIIGGGASGTLVAASMLQNAKAPISVAIIEPREQVGLGVAYSTQSPLHTLNVRAKGMSAIVGDPNHFVNWSGIDREDFAPRSVYGKYLQSILHNAKTNALPSSRLEHIQDFATQVIAGSDHVTIQVLGGRKIRAEKMVLATGNESPTIPQWIPDDVVSHPRFVANPWKSGTLEAITSGTVVAVGTGLTFVDVAMSVLENPNTHMVGVSRHGLLPTAHTHVGHPPKLPKLETLQEVFRWLREDPPQWRERVNGLRTITQQLWKGFSESERKRFLRLAVRYWEIHRHRIAEKTAASLNEYFNDERLEVRKGSVVSMIGQMDGGIGLKLLSGEELHADWVVLCTGPSEHATHNNLPIASLEKQGIVVPGVFHMGLRCEPETGAVIGVDGLYSHQIYVVGPLRKGELWESTAIPEIHVQADALGKLLVQ